MAGTWPDKHVAVALVRPGQRGKNGRESCNPFTVDDMPLYANIRAHDELTPWSRAFDRWLDGRHGDSFLR
jgi:hypothetical protein